MTTPTRSRRRRRVGLVSAAALTAGALTAVPLIATAAHPAQDLFALDGYVVDQGGDPPYDWDDIFTQSGDPDDEPDEATLPAGGISSDFQRDFLTSGTDSTNGPDLSYVNGDQTYYATGSKDTLDIPGWQCKKTNNATDKGDYVNAYGFAANVDVGGTNHIIFYFGLEKDDDNGTNNIGVWLLQDGEVACFSESGKAVDFSGVHKDGDLLAVVEYDSGGNVGTATGYLWKDPDGDGPTPGFLDSTPAFTENQAKCSAAQVNASKFCIVTNADGTRSTPWWSPQKADKTPGAVLQTNVFVEGFLDISNVFGTGNEPCFASAIADTRASTSLTAALYDFVSIQAPTCGPLVVRKYLDKGADKLAGGQAFGDEANPVGQGWTIKVFADGADPATATPLYEGTTGADGTVAFSDVPFGDYDVYEVLKDGNWYNTDPGSAAPIKQDVTKGTGTDTVTFGNACYVDKTFQVTNVPDGAALKVTYTIGAGSPVDANMATSGGTASYTLTDTLKPTDTVTWSYSYQSGPGGSITVATNESLSDYTFDPNGNCTKLNTTEFPYATVTGMKYKDADANGNEDDPDNGLGGFDFTLYTGDAGDSGTQVDTATSADGSGSTTLGEYSFSNVAPGTYSVVETQQSGWLQTAPTAGDSPTFRTVTVDLGDTSKTVGKFLNTPLTDVQVRVTPQTTSSEATINCFKDSVAGTRIGDEDTTPGGTPTEPKVRDATGLTVGTYVCTVVITDP